MVISKHIAIENIIRRREDVNARRFLNENRMFIPCVCVLIF